MAADSSLLMLPATEGCLRLISMMNCALEDFYLSLSRDWTYKHRNASFLHSELSSFHAKDEPGCITMFTESGMQWSSAQVPLFYAKVGWHHGS
jgi:hypothetical protein